MKEERNILNAAGTEIAIITRPDETDYISLTDIAKHRDPENPRIIIANWMRNRSTLEFLGLWEQLHNPDFKRLEFDTFKNESGANAFVMTPEKWTKSTAAIGITTKRGRYGGGTYAHTDIAFEFASWLSPEFKLYIIQDYKRLKSDEAHQLRLEWKAKRLISKANYRLHTDAVQKHLVHTGLTRQQINYVYADEADVINVALFGMTAKEWRSQHPDAKGNNMRDEATITELVVLGNLESMNAEFIRQGLSQSQRLMTLRSVAAYQIKTLQENASTEKLGALLLPAQRPALNPAEEPSKYE